MKRILVVDDEKNMGMVLKMLLENDGYSVVTAPDGREAIKKITNGDIVDLIISDLRMPHIDGMEILEFLQQTNRKIPFVIITAYGSIECAVEAMKKGATDFITKPFNKDIILHIVHRILQVETLEDENKLLRDTFRKTEFVYRSNKMAMIAETVKKVSTTNTPVLITGESGTGKGLIARMIHTMGEGASGQRPFVSINCPGIPETLFESELFGYQKGAFTGATKDFKGKVRMADGGTLFLDEITEIPLNIQPKFLRLLEEKSFEPLGSTATICIDARIICATNRDLKELIRERLFREDLYYRINAIAIDIPPLRERKEDIPSLVEHFLTKISKELGKDIKTVAKDAQRALQKYHWHGNVRELYNVLERAIVLTNKDVIQLSDLPYEIQVVPYENAKCEGNKLEESEKKILTEALRKFGWNISAAARELGITRSTLRYRMNKYFISSG